MSEKLRQFEACEPIQKMSGNIPKDKAVFYELAKERITYQTRAENIAWNKVLKGKDNIETTGSYIINARKIENDNDSSFSQFVGGIEIVVNQGLFEDLSVIVGEDYCDLIPYLVEHEIYEAWLVAKGGVGRCLSGESQHLLARRREFYLAALDGNAEKAHRFSMMVNPDLKDEYDQALTYALHRVEQKKPK